MKPIFKDIFSKTRRLLPVVAAVASLGATADAAVPGIAGTSFNLIAQDAYLTQPDGQALYSWGYGCATGSSPTLQPNFPGKTCNTMQVPGPTLIVNEVLGDIVVTLTNKLPQSAGNTSILFPGLNVTATGGVPGLLTQEAQPSNCDTNANAQCNVVTYTIHNPTPGTHSYYSGTQSDLQIEMGLFGAIIVLPNATPSSCTSGLHATNVSAGVNWGETVYANTRSAYDNANTCYDREYLFQFSEADPAIHWQAMNQVNACGTTAGCTLHVATEPYHPAYFMINGRSMPDDMDANYAPQYPHQPYNGNPHMHPGEQVLLRIIGQGRWQHPFHEHANHVRVLARDGNLLLTNDTSGALAGPALFTTTTTPGQTIDGIFYYTGRGLNWDMYGHNPNSPDANATLTCTPDANGYNTGFAASDATFSGTPTPNAAPANAINYYEWCQDHNKPLQVSTSADVASGGPVTLPDPNILVNGAWFGGSPYLGPDATTRATFGTPCAKGQTSGCGTSGTTPPSGTIANDPSSEAGFAFMWHSHNEREITTNNAFPGGMMMMMLVDSREFVIDESM